MSAVLLAYLRWSDPKNIDVRKKNKIRELKAKAKKLEHIRDALLDNPQTDYCINRLGYVINRLAELRKQIRQLEAA